MFKIKRFFKTIGRLFLIALFIILPVIIGSTIDYHYHLETYQGLDRLFQWRGVRTPPDEIVLVAMDEASDERFDVWQNLPDWRGLHAKLVQELTRQGVALIIFDLAFMSKQPEQDQDFAAAIKEAGNVLLFDCTQQKRSQSASIDARSQCGRENKVPILVKENPSQKADPFADIGPTFRLNYPVEPMLSSALDHAPFVLANDASDPVVREVYLFIDDLGETPTLPMLAWVHYLNQQGKINTGVAPTKHISAWLSQQRQQCSQGKSPGLSMPTNTQAMQLQQTLCGDSGVWLDFYGPPYTIRTVSYSEVYDGQVTDLKGKVVFVGKLEKTLGKTQDVFPMPFVDTETGRMAGVEFMATQFGNLLENRFVRAPVPPVLANLAFSLVISLVLLRLTLLRAIALCLSISLGYVLAVFLYFKSQGGWLPIAVPILVQLPLSLLLAAVWAWRETRQREIMLVVAFARRFPNWKNLLPETFSHIEYKDIDIQRLEQSNRKVFGLCLSTDIENYTVIAKTYDSDNLMTLLQSYFQVLVSPVRLRQGIVANVIADSMMALWIDASTGAMRYNACLAALEIEQAITEFNKNSGLAPLYTRIGLHEGLLTLGRLIPENAENENPIGDPANSASRIEGVNKHLKTKILASKDIVMDLPDIVYRSVGIYALPGRMDRPLELVEVAGRAADVSQFTLQLFERFAKGLHAFNAGHWQEAISMFQSVLSDYGNDGPSQFLLVQALKHRDNPPADWQGVIGIHSK